jgi:anti-anti-sigma factor
METQIELKTLEIKDHPDAKLVKFIGDLDATNVETILEEISELINGGTPKIVADFEKLRYVNSTGLGILLHLSKASKEKNGCFKIANVNENVYEIVEIIGATTLLEIFENAEEAITSLK